MTNSIEVSGKTEDEAIQVALDQLGLTRDDVSVEIIERAKSGFLGLKNSPAVVRVIYEEQGGHANKVKSYLSGLFKLMDVEASLEITEAESAVNVIIAGNDPGILIGRRGETLDAIQRLTNYSINRGSDSRIRVTLDAENYRQRRNETLESIAEKTASRVLKYRRNVTLDPMNAYERHIVHAALQNYDNITTFSVGEEPNRKIVVAFGRKNDGARFDDRTNRPGGGRPRAPGGSRPPARGGRGPGDNRSRGSAPDAAERAPDKGAASADSEPAHESSPAPETGSANDSGRKGTSQYREWS